MRAAGATEVVQEARYAIWWAPAVWAPDPQPLSG